MFDEIWPLLGPADAVLAEAADPGWCCARFAAALADLAATVGATLAAEMPALRAGHARWRGMPAARNLPPPFAVLDRFAQLGREWLRVPVLRVAAPATAGGALSACFAAWPEGVAVYRFTAAAASLAMRADGIVLAGTESVRDPALWQAMRETVAEDAALARPYLWRLLGRRPVWGDYAALLPLPVELSGPQAA